MKTPSLYKVQEPTPIKINPKFLFGSIFLISILFFIIGIFGANNLDLLLLMSL